MGLRSDLTSDLSSFARFLRERWRRVAFMILFFAFLGVLGWWRPSLLPIILAAAFVIPQRLTIRAGTQFTESDFTQFSPMLSNRTNYRFLGVVLLFTALPAGDRKSVV